MLSLCKSFVVVVVVDFVVVVVVFVVDDEAIDYYDCSDEWQLLIQ